MFPQNIGASIRALRKQQNMSQRQLAEKIEVDPTLIPHWESEKENRCPNIDNLISLSEVFNCSIEEVLGISPNVAPSIPLDSYSPKEVLIIQALLREYNRIRNDPDSKERNV